jgi:hypothetical protein
MGYLLASLLFFCILYIGLFILTNRHVEGFEGNDEESEQEKFEDDIDEDVCIDEDTKKARKASEDERRRLARLKKKKKGKKEVFLIYNKFNYIEAQEACKKYSGRLATEEELQDAYEDGANWCVWGWLDDQMIGHPVTEKFWSETEKVHKGFCGPKAGVNKLYNIDPMKRFSVNCYGIKPKKTRKDKALDNMNKIDHVSKAIKECKLAKQMDVERHKSFTEQMKNLRLVSFNEQKWSDRYK